VSKTFPRDLRSCWRSPEFHQQVPHKSQAQTAYFDDIGWEDINFKEVLCNNGNAYDLRTHLFTAPVSGVYHFELHMRPISDQSDIAIMGFPGAFIHAQGHGTTRNATITAGTTIPLKAGEQMKARAWGSFDSSRDGTTLHGQSDLRHVHFSSPAATARFNDPSGGRMCRFAGFLVTPTNLE
jgi:hypothetical protein